MAIDIEIYDVTQVHEIDCDIGSINNIETSLVNNWSSVEVPAEVSLVNFAKAEAEVSLVSLIHSPPLNPLCVPLKSGVVFLQWEKPNNNALQYEIFISYYNSINEDTFTLIEITENTMVFISELPIETSMYFKIRAKYIDNSYSILVDFKKGKMKYDVHNFRVISIPGTIIEKDAIIGFTQEETGYTVKVKNLYELTL